MVSEIVSTVIIVIVVLGVGYGLYVSHQRDSMVDKAVMGLAEVKSRVEAAAQGGDYVTCDNSLVESELLENEFIPLTITPVQLDQANRSLGFGPGIIVKSSRDVDGNNRFVSAERLHQSLVDKAEEEGYSVRLNLQGDDDIAYTVLVSASANCATS